jgi:hypothetical protein
MSGVLIFLLLTSAGAVSGIPQYLYSKYKDKFGYTISKKWLDIKKSLGFFDAKKQIYFEKTKTEKAISKLIEVICGYESIIEETNFEINKLIKNQANESIIKELKEKVNKIVIKSQEARMFLTEQKNNLLEINKFILEVESDSIFYKMDKSSTEENVFLKHKVDISNLKDKKHV